jgi:hypothetical protein
MGVRRVEKLDHERVLLEHFLHDAALDADAASMNQPHLAQTGGVSRADVLVDNRPDVRGLKAVEVEATFDRDLRSAP